ncbi:unnamed protein product [Pleuronectes platessa]|uniref:Uncharacterized protein n=1 Tax=Pleuronectes platessa TaxID=8262 RepID=A0A9N7YIG7_PLEPL|nr:unnamed protein product [Pleuronectes platessa]
MEVIQITGAGLDPVDLSRLLDISFGITVGYSATHRSHLQLDPDCFFPTQERAGAARSSPREKLYPCVSAWALTF